MSTYGVAPPAYRLPEATAVGPVRLQVANLNQSLAWYRGVLGLELLDRSDDAAALGVGPDGTVLMELRQRPGARPAGGRGRLGLYHFAILLPNRASLGRFVAHLAQLGLRAGMADHLVSEAVYLSDPDGLGIEVYADRPRESWRHADRQLLMATDPLDVADLVAAGGGTPWRGMPAGTRMGHVHLHVGDLPAADRFYHSALGLDRMVWSYPGALFLAAGGYHHHLGTNTWAGDVPPAGSDDARLLDWTLVVPGPEDVARAAASLRGAGYAVADAGNGVLAQDPWNTAVRITTGEAK